jgi:hypothetical protein
VEDLPVEVPFNIMQRMGTGHRQRAAGPEYRNLILINSRSMAAYERHTLLEVVVYSRCCDATVKWAFIFSMARMKAWRMSRA